LNDVSTTNETMEYMAFGLPVLAFDLRETRVSASEAAAYAKPNDVRDMARPLVELLEDQPAAKQCVRLAAPRYKPSSLGSTKPSAT